ncbi:hypothetical protein [Caldisphaera lagunensis]|uniref:hypothetical protein n=1 Tax=Caldisphaera lagunensis TaxID=200415 RepID=UPI0006629214|nr:hypothetical protein [Caldisphaera lagunensis]
MPFKIYNQYGNDKKGSPINYFLSITRNQNIKSSEDIVNMIYNEINRLCIGLRMVLDSHFYSKYGKNYVEILISNPYLAYNESLKILSEDSVRLIFKTILKTFNINHYEIEMIINEISKGNDRALKQDFHHNAF